MNKQVIVTNRKWFKNYSLIRTISVVLALAFIVYKYFAGIEDSFILNVFTGLSLSLLITILIFDYFQKPSFLELIKENSKIILKQYQPDRRYLFFLKESNINTIELSENDRLGYKFYKNEIPLLNQIEFYAKGENKEIIKTKKINVAWIKNDQLEKLSDLVQNQGGE